MGYPGGERRLVGPPVQETWNTRFVTTADGYGGLAARFYSAYIVRPLLGRAVIRLVWGGDARLMYAALEGLRDLPADVTVLDGACGAGLALHWLSSSWQGRYLGIDVSPTMLARSREVARRRALHGAELALADIGAIPLDDATADVCLLYNALNAVPGARARRRRGRAVPQTARPARGKHAAARREASRGPPVRARGETPERPLGTGRNPRRPSPLAREPARRRDRRCRRACCISRTTVTPAVQRSQHVNHDAA